LPVFRVTLSTVTACIVRHEHIFDIAIEFVQIDVGEYRTDDAALRRSRITRFVRPVFHNASLQTLADEVEQSPILDVSCQSLQKQLMVDVVETSAYVTFDEPLGRTELVMQIGQRG